VKTAVKTYVFEEKLVDTILGYLGSKPYVEVTNLISEIAETIKSQQEPQPPVVLRAVRPDGEGKPQDG
jgi:hypothetical protein